VRWIVAAQFDLGIGDGRTLVAHHRPFDRAPLGEVDDNRRRVIPDIGDLCFTPQITFSRGDMVVRAPPPRELEAPVRTADDALGAMRSKQGDGRIADAQAMALDSSTNRPPVAENDALNRDVWALEVFVAGLMGSVPREDDVRRRKQGPEVEGPGVVRLAEEDQTL
jgi:hypothetical protein